MGLLRVEQIGIDAPSWDALLDLTSSRNKVLELIDGFKSNPTINTDRIVLFMHIGTGPGEEILRVRGMDCIQNLPVSLMLPLSELTLNGVRFEFPAALGVDEAPSILVDLLRHPRLQLDRHAEGSSLAQVAFRECHNLLDGYGLTVPVRCSEANMVLGYDCSCSCT